MGEEASTPPSTEALHHVMEALRPIDDRPALRPKKRPRRSEELLGLVRRCEAALEATEPSTVELLEGVFRLHRLVATVERRLAAKRIDALTPQLAVAFILRRRVRVVKVVENSFDLSGDDDSDDDEEGDEDVKENNEDVNEKASGADAKAEGTGSGAEPPTPAEDLASAVASRSSGRRRLVVCFQLAKERITVSCGAEGDDGKRPCYWLEMRHGVPPRSTLLLRLESHVAPGEGSMSWDAWEALRSSCGYDFRCAGDFARDIALLGVLPELARHFAREESESEEGPQGLVPTLSACRAMVDAALPTAERRLSEDSSRQRQG